MLGQERGGVNIGGGGRRALTLRVAVGATEVAWRRRWSWRRRRGVWGRGDWGGGGTLTWRVKISHTPSLCYGYGTPQPNYEYNKGA